VRLGDLAPATAATILVVGQLAADASGSINNTATVTSTTALAADSVLVSTVALTAAPTADLAIVKQATPTAAPGDTLVYTLTVYNAGPSTARMCG
jgi:hypothetical protein